MKRDMSDEEIDLAKAQDDRWKMLKAKGTPTTEDYNQRLNDLYKRYGITADKQSGGMSMQMDETEKTVQQPVKASSEQVKQLEKKPVAVSKEEVKKPVRHKKTVSTASKTPDNKPITHKPQSLSLVHEEDKHTQKAGKLAVKVEPDTKHSEPEVKASGHVAKNGLLYGLEKLNAWRRKKLIEQGRKPIEDD